MAAGSLVAVRRRTVQLHGRTVAALITAVATGRGCGQRMHAAAQRAERRGLAVETGPAAAARRAGVRVAFARKRAGYVAGASAAGRIGGRVLFVPVGYVEALQRRLDAQLVLAEGGIVVVQFLQFVLGRLFSGERMGKNSNVL